MKKVCSKLFQSMVNKFNTSDTFLTFTNFLREVNKTLQITELNLNKSRQINTKTSNFWEIYKKLIFQTT